MIQLPHNCQISAPQSPKEMRSKGCSKRICRVILYANSTLYSCSFNLHQFLVSSAVCEIYLIWLGAELYATLPKDQKMSKEASLVNFNNYA